jgi:hypothetical protein
VSQSRNARPAHESIEGRVEQRNDTGIRIAGEWYNRSRFHHVDLPDVGSLVSLDVDDKGFIRSITPLEDQDEPQFVSAESATRLSVLQAAAAFAAGRTDIKSADVLRIAEVWLEWVERDAG